MGVPLLTTRLGEVVKARRKQVGISQEELADRAHLHRTYISLLERGHRTPSVETLAVIAAALEVTAAQLLAQAEVGG